MPKIAIICDWLTNYGGAERVIETISNLYPEAPIFTSIFNEEKMPSFKGTNIITSFIQKLPGSKLNHRPFLKLMPYAFEQFDLSGYDIVLSSSHSAAKGVITKAETLHISYCHNPMRYVWDDFHDYINRQRIPKFLRGFVHYALSDIRVWDRMAADRVDAFVANSNCVKKRIKKFYRRDSDVIYPPCNIDKFNLSEKEGTYFLAIGRLIAYKRFDLIVEAFNKNKLPLKIVGEGGELEHLKEMAKSNIQFLGRVPENELSLMYENCKALIFPQFEDFGIIPVEAMACGRPVICFAKGGALETVIDKKTGIYFQDQTSESLNHGIKEFLETEFDFKKIRAHCEKFSGEKFEAHFSQYVRKTYKAYNNNEFIFK